MATEQPLILGIMYASGNPFEQVDALSDLLVSEGTLGFKVIYTANLIQAYKQENSIPQTTVITPHTPELVAHHLRGHTDRYAAIISSYHGEEALDKIVRGGLFSRPIIILTPLGRERTSTDQVQRVGPAGLEEAVREIFSQ